MLLREAQQNKGHPLAKVRFAILVGGFVPRDAAIAASSKRSTKAKRSTSYRIWSPRLQDCKVKVIFNHIRSCPSLLAVQ